MRIRRFVDLSAPLVNAENGVAADPPGMIPQIEYIGYMLRASDIVLVNTSAGEAYGEPDYLDCGCGLGREATLWLLESGVRVVGTDAGVNDSVLCKGPSADDRHGLSSAR